MASFSIATVALLLQLVAFSSASEREGSVSKFQILDVLGKSDSDGVGSIVVDNSQGLGRQFEGIGAISGGGATSKLLVNYPEKERNEILDYLFKPNFGASLQIFKVEIGGDVQSTDGTEASHMHDKWEENYTRGYEWWLMKEAKKRNPDIKLYGLPWGFPGWIGQGTNNPYINPAQTADYVVRWVNASKTLYNLTIDYIGIWNERHYNVKYIKTLRRVLDERGFKNTKIIAADGGWGISKDIEKDKNLAASVHAIGCHYPGTYSSKEAKQTKKPLWASEDYSTFDNLVGGGCWARILNQNYVHGLMTSTISWNLIGSYYPHLPFYRDGLMHAVQPWSGNYDVASPVWMTAHTTQFARIGWRYLQHGQGVGKLPKGGSYVSLTNQDADQLTIVIETMTHDHSKCIRPWLPPYKVTPQTVTLKLQGAFKGIQSMNVWYSKLKFHGAQSDFFQKKEPLIFTEGEATLKLGLDEIITVTTVNSGHKGSHPTPPAAQPFPQTVTDTFDGYREHAEPYYLAPQIGSLEVLNIDGKTVARQTVLQRPVHWCKAETADKTMSIIGDHSWHDMNITVAFSIPAVNGTTGVFLAVRVNRGGCGSLSARGIFFFVFPETKSFIVSKDLARKQVLMKGPISGVTGEQQISLQVHNNVAAGQVGEKKIFWIHLTDAPKTGWAAIGTDSYGYADFDYFALRGPESIEKNNY